MELAYIKFNNREDQVRGFYELATKAKVITLPNGLYSVSLKSLELLDAQNVSYRRATDQEEMNCLLSLPKDLPALLLTCS